MPEPGYIVDPIETDEDQLQQEAFDWLQEQWPDWSPNESNLETWVIGACARMVAQARDVAADVPRAILRYLGEHLVRVEPIDPTPATVTSTWTLKTNPAGRTIEAGTLAGIENGDGDVIPFEVVSDVVLVAADLATDTGEVTLRSIEEGEYTSNLGGVGELALNMNSISWVDEITLEGITTDGTDGETDDEYLDRLSLRLTLLTPRPILPDDFGLLAADIAAQGGAKIRWVVLDNYNPVDDTYDNPKMVALSMVDLETGADVPIGIRDTIRDQLEALREINFVVNVMNPVVTPVDITFVGVASLGYDPAIVEAAAEQAVADYVSRANWGQPMGLEEPWWVNQTKVRHQDLSTVLNQTEGFSHWTTLTFGLDGGAQDTTDKDLDGAIALTEPGTISGTVS